MTSPYRDEKIIARARIVIVTIWVFWSIVFVASLQLDASFSAPRCYEDESIIGSGLFANGTWSTYVCGPVVDDYRFDINDITIAR